MTTLHHLRDVTTEGSKENALHGGRLPGGPLGLCLLRSAGLGDDGRTAVSPHLVLSSPGSLRASAFLEVT